MDKLVELYILWQLPWETKEQWEMRKVLRARVAKHPRHRQELAYIQEHRDMTRYNVLCTSCWELSTEGDVRQA